MHMKTLFAAAGLAAALTACGNSDGNGAAPPLNGTLKKTDLEFLAGAPGVAEAPSFSVFLKQAAVARPALQSTAAPKPLSTEP